MNKNVFDKNDCDAIINRIQNLSELSQPNWGKMNVSQMLAHCNVPYLYTFEQEQFKKPNAFKKLMLKLFVKSIVVSEKPYKKNSITAPEFLITNIRDFEKEKAKLIENINKTQQLGEQYFDQLENFSFGKMTVAEWNNMFYKHLEHHLSQFGV